MNKQLYRTPSNQSGKKHQFLTFSYNLLVVDTNKSTFTTEEMAPSTHTTSTNKIISQLQTLNYTCKTFPSNFIAEESQVGKKEKGRCKGEKVPPSNQRDSF